MARMVVVDDEMIVLRLVEEALTDEGHEVVPFEDPTLALDAVIDNPPDLLITDIRMPGMSGMELAEKAHAHHPDLPVIFMTGYANITSAKDAIKQRAADYIMKPFELTEMRQAVANALEAQEAAEERSDEAQYNRLSGLAQMLFASGDWNSIVPSTIRFAMLHQNACCGAALLASEEAGTIVAIDDDAHTDTPVDAASLQRVLDSLDVARLYDPQVIATMGNDAIWQKLTAADAIPWPDSIANQGALVVVPVASTHRYHGIILLGFSTTTDELKKADRAFLAIIGRQLAINLDNLRLLQETQHAYSRLNELQDETIELEKMATKGEMSAEIGHELNNFLGVVSGNVSLLELYVKKGKPDALAKPMDAIQRTIEKMTSFTSGLMDMSKLAGQKKCIEANRLLTDVIEFLKPQKRYRQVELNFSPASDEIWFDADTTQIQQVLYNLFNNAADAMVDSTTRVIDASLSANDDPERFVLTLKDTGRGFTEAEAMKAFNTKFTTKEHGHGYGLVVCGRIIAQHGGTVEIDSAPDKGTTMTITFPRSTQAIPEAVVESV